MRCTYTGSETVLKTLRHPGIGGLFKPVLWIENEAHGDKALPIRSWTNEEVRVTWATA